MDLEFVDGDRSIDDECDYVYAYEGEKYGVKKFDIDSILIKKDAIFIIIRNARCIQQIKNDYAKYNVVVVYVYTERASVVSRLSADSFTDEEVQFRLNRLSVAYEDYRKRPDIYDHILINNSSIEDYHRLIETMIEKYIRPALQNERYVMALMSFNKESANLEDYFNAMRRASMSFGIACERVDQMQGSFEISTAAKNKMLSSPLSIVDLTENKQNVYYELGFLHGSGRKCIITAHNDTDVMFYPSQYRIIKYKNASELERMLKPEISAVFG